MGAARTLVGGAGDERRVRTRARVQGTVQGVGFRPFVYRLAREEQLGGYVLNDEHGVLLEVEGDPDAVRRFLTRLRSDAPPLASIDAVSSDALAPRHEREFRILESARTGGTSDAPVTADWATCPDCLAELTDPGDRRHRYPFINCTNCGPRFTIVRGVPYDRELTTMAPFSMCAACRREYDDPADRRFHAQPNACPECGPSVRLIEGGSGAGAGAGRTGGGLVRAGRDSAEAGRDSAGAGRDSAGAGDPIGDLAERLAAGAIAAVKGLGGYHLVCDAAHEDAVAALRARKHREDKPFALMASGVQAARALIELGPEQERLLCSGQRPIVLGRRRPGARVAAAVAPGAPELGVMLPYTPLHHLLLADFGAVGGGGDAALVMTSGNISDEPIAYEDDDALARLRGIADLFLVHDRRIATRTDDSVARIASVAGRLRPLMIRRSRGYVPGHLPLPGGAGAPPLLACGAEQKSTFCVAKGGRAWVSHHIGDLEHEATLRAFTDGIAHFQALFAVTPAVVAHDLHPDYLSTRYALERDGLRLIGVQHHHAHLAACLAEHGVAAEPAVGAIFDGTGYGSDGTVWGGELLAGGVGDVQRAGRLWTVRMPGGAAAVRQPWRMARAWLDAAYDEPRGEAGETPPLPRRLAGAVDPAGWAAMGRIGASAEFSPVTSSMGRLFDAVGALCGLVAEASYEGQAAVELEAAAWRAGGRGDDRYEIELRPGDDGLIIDPRRAVRAIAEDLEGAADADLVAARFHAGLARVTVDAVTAVAGERGLGSVVLSGGVFQNRLLLESVAAGCAAAGLRVLVPERLPPNDGGISYGQAAVAAAVMRAPGG